MDPLETYQRLQAMHTGRAVSSATRCHVHLSARPLVVAAYHLAGELGGPLAMMWGTSSDPESAHFTVVPEPRNRALRFASLDRFGRDLDSYLGAFTARIPEPRRGQPDAETAVDAPQIIVPNAATAEWLLGVVGRFTRYLPVDGDAPAPPAVRRGGQHLTWFGQQRRLPGSSVALAATDLLAAHYVTGQLEGETQNLAALLGWIDPDVGSDGPTSAARAEQESPPAGPVTDPAWDADVLQRLIQQWHDADRSRDDAARARAEAEIEAAARAQLEPGWTDTWRAVAILRRLPEADHVQNRWERDRRWWAAHAARMATGDAAFRKVPDPVSAARTLNLAESLSAELEAQMALDDPAVMARAVARGDALAGTVAAVDPSRREIVNGRRAIRPSIIVTPDIQFGGPAGTRLHLATAPGVTAEVVTTNHPGVELRVVAGANTRNTAPRLPAVGDHVVFGPYGTPDRYPTSLPDAVPWTHAPAAPARVPA